MGLINQSRECRIPEFKACSSVPGGLVANGTGGISFSTVVALRLKVKRRYVAATSQNSAVGIVRFFVGIRRFLVGISGLFIRVCGLFVGIGRFLIRIGRLLVGVCGLFVGISGLLLIWIVLSWTEPRGS